MQLPLFANTERPNVAVHVPQRRGEKRADQRAATENFGRLAGVYQRSGQCPFQNL